MHSIFFAFVSSHTVRDCALSALWIFCIEQVIMSPRIWCETFTITIFVKICNIYICIYVYKAQLPQGSGASGKLKYPFGNVVLEVYFVYVFDMVCFVSDVSALWAQFLFSVCFVCFMFCVCEQRMDSSFVNWHRLGMMALRKLHKECACMERAEMFYRYNVFRDK